MYSDADFCLLCAMVSNRILYRKLTHSFSLVLSSSPAIVQRISVYIILRSTWPRPRRSWARWPSCSPSSPDSQTACSWPPSSTPATACGTRSRTWRKRWGELIKAGSTDWQYCDTLKNKVDLLLNFKKQSASLNTSVISSGSESESESAFWSNKHVL